MLHLGRQLEPLMHRLFENRITRWRKRADVKCANCDTANSSVAVTFPINCAATVGTEVEPDAIARIGHALKNTLFTLEPHAFFQKGRAIMKRCSSSALTGLAVTQIDTRRFA